MLFQQILSSGYLVPSLDTLHALMLLAWMDHQNQRVASELTFSFFFFLLRQCVPDIFAIKQGCHSYSQVRYRLSDDAQIELMSIHKDGRGHGYPTWPDE